MVDKPKFPEIAPEEHTDNLLDLDAYRTKRERAGTWPLSREDLFKFWYQWRQDKGKR